MIIYPTELSKFKDKNEVIEYITELGYVSLINKEYIENDWKIFYWASFNNESIPQLKNMNIKYSIFETTNPCCIYGLSLWKENSYLCYLLFNPFSKEAALFKLEKYFKEEFFYLKLLT
jgi:hypothetical protein